MKRPGLREHQIRAFDYCCKNEYVIMALDPRLGKTRVAIEIKEMFNHKCLVIVPAYLVDNWKIEIKKWVSSPKILAIHSGKEIPTSEYLRKSKTQYTIVSYSLVQKAPHLFEWAEMVVLDEAPAIKNMASKRSQFIHKEIFENSIKRVLLLTGTPIKNRVQEFYSLLALTYYNPNTPQGQFLDLYPDEITFADEFSHRESYDMEINGRYITVTKWSGIKNVEDLKMWLQNRYIRIRDTEVLDMPEVSVKPVLISESPDKNLLNAFNDFFLEEDDGVPTREKDRKERTGSVLPEHKAMAALKKVPFTVSYAKDLLEEVECVLVYTDHVPSAHAIAKELGTVAITGEMPPIKRGLLADRFQAGEGRVLVATVGSLKEGKDLFRANHLIFNDLSWIPGDIKQVVNRIRVVGKKTPCTIHRILGSPQDLYISEVLDDKVDTINKAT